MAEYVEPWLMTLDSANTLVLYRRRVRAWVVWCVARGAAPSRADSADVDLYREDLERSGLGASAVTARISAVSSWYKWLLSVGRAETNPAAPARGGICTVDGCAREHYGLGFCAMHYKRFKAHGDPSTVKTKPTVAERTCTECEYLGPRAEFWGDRRICKPCRPIWEARIHAQRAASGASKWCPGCRTTKNLSLFSRNQPLCKPCTKAAKAKQQAQRRKSGRPLLCIGPCEQVLPPTAFDPGYRTCRRCRFEANPEKYRRQWRARRAREHSALGGYQTWEWISLLVRFNGQCAYCDAAPAATQDHVIPLTRGGSNFASNLLPACWSCNAMKHDSLLAEWRYRRSGAPALARLTMAKPLGRLP
jgi:hypothetical protein